MTGPPVPFSSLPYNKSIPNTKLNAWGVYGDKDEKGFLNRQTDEIVKAAAASEIKTGARISLNLPLDFQKSKPLFDRQAFHKNVYQKGTRVVNDDVWTFNTQSSSQWDGFRHFAYQKAERFYNNVSMDDIHKNANGKGENFLGIQNFQDQGIVGRGVLVDFDRWRATQKDNKEVQDFQCFRADGIKLEWIKQILKEQRTEVRFGDILFLRSGYTKTYYALSEKDVDEIRKSSPPPLCGMDQSIEGLEWIWNNFSAVAGDHPAFERYVFFPLVLMSPVQFLFLVSFQLRPSPAYPLCRVQRRLQVV